MSVDAELLKAFYVESGEILERLDGDLQKMEGSPDDEVVNSVFRGLHTVKGNSSFLSLTQVTKLAHAAETLLDKARKKELPITPVMVELVREVFEELKAMIVEQETDRDQAALIERINAFMSGKAPAVAPKAAVPAAPSAPAASVPKVAAAAFVRVDEAKINKIVSLVSELELMRYTLEKIPDRIDELDRAAQDLRFDVDLQVSKLSRITRGLSGLVFGVRLVPVNQVFLRFPRVVKDLAAKLGKEIHLSVQNGDAELDKSIVEAIADPMTHLIRNSADHGIESPADRLKAGKPREGVIRLNSYVRGNFVYIEISDDGKGIDGDKILAKAVEKGIVPADKVSAFTESKKLALIFAPGFSTAEKVTDISGRGVGMDVVKSNINRLKGTVLIESKVGQGTTIKLRFPMSIAVLFSLFVDVNNTCCALPVEQVNESVDFTPGELLTSLPEGADPAGYLALYSIKTVLWGVPEEADGRKLYHALCFKDEKGRGKAFLVDEYSSIEEAIVQSVDSYIAALPGLQGATIRKDGSVGLVLNPESIVEHSTRAKPFAYAKIKVKEEVTDASLSDFLEMSQTG